MTVQELYDRTFAKTALLSSMQMPWVIPPLDVIRPLNAAKIRFVLVGAYGIAGWKAESRGTEDVDIVVAARQVKKAVACLLDLFPQLEPVNLSVVTRLRDRGDQKVVIDVMKPVQQPYLELARDMKTHTVAVTAGKDRYRVPSLEMALVMKFAAMTSLYRANEDKYRDAHDFIRMVKNNENVDREGLTRLAQTMYADAGKDILKMVDDAAADKMLVL